MPTLIRDPDLEKTLLAKRAAHGADKYDEVWEGIYMMAPMPNDEHQQIVNRFAAVFQETIDWPGLGDVRPGVNVSDRKHDWQENYRIPDVAVFLSDTMAENCGTFWFGGPDFAVEIISPWDPIEEKLDFYAAVGTRELLIVDRDPWRLRLVARNGDEMVSQSEAKLGETVASQVLPSTFALAVGEKRPMIDVQHSDGKRWEV